YVIPGERGAGQVCINGAAAHLVAPGDVVILIAYGTLSDADARTYLPNVVFVDEHNRIVELSDEPGLVPAGHGLEASGLPFAPFRDEAAGHGTAVRPA